MSRRTGRGSAPYRAMSDADALRYLVELTAYVNGLADTGSAMRRLVTYVATGEEEYLRAR